LSGRRIAQALGQAASCQAEILADHFDINANDEDWLPEVGARGWILVTKDKRIQRRQNEIEAIVNAKVRAFIFLDGELSREVMIALIKLLMPKILEAIRDQVAPFVFGIEAPGKLVRLYPPISELAPKI
jgi:hypothetical protein